MANDAKEDDSSKLDECIATHQHNTGSDEDDVVDGSKSGRSSPKGEKNGRKNSEKNGGGGGDSPPKKDDENPMEDTGGESEPHETTEAQKSGGRGGAEDGRSRFFSLTQVSVKINELWSNAKERVFGEDYWIPSDPFEVVDFRSDLLASYCIVFPAVEDTAAANGGSSPLMVVQGSIKDKEPSSKALMNHVVYAVEENGGRRRTFTIFRSNIVEEALDFCRRYEECRVLFRTSDQKKDLRKLIWDVTFVMKEHPLWRMAHIAILCQRVDIFTDDGLAYLERFDYSVTDLVQVACSPEGLFPLMLAVQTNQDSIVRFLLKHGADLTARDPVGNNALHYAALVSTQMLETLLEQEAGKALINSRNNAGETPSMVALRAVNPLCMKTLFNHGGDLLNKSTDKNPLIELIQSSKGNTPDAIRVLLEKSPSLLLERDATNGNTCLHAANQKASLMSLLQLKHKELDLNARNKAGFTSLHQFVMRGDLGMVMCLLSYGAGLDEQADSGKMTALHFAVSKRNLQITRLLLCLGADPNVANAHGDTPRHLAAKLNEVDLLKSLIICDARRCPLTKVGCVSGCVNEKQLNKLKRPSTSSMPSSATGNTTSTSTAASSTASSSSSSSTTSASAAAAAATAPPTQPAAGASTTAPKPASYTSVMVEDFENRAFDKEQFRFNKLLDIQHNDIYDEVLDKLPEVSSDEGSPPDHNFINVLSLDGGGIRGLVIIQLLICAERIMGEPIFPYFDWVGGTSTGAMVAAGLAMGQTLHQIQRLYLRFKDMVFDYRRPHNTQVLEKFICQEMGAETMFSDLKWPRLMFTTTRADFFPVQLEQMRNYKLPTNDEENEELGYRTPDDLLLWKVLRRSSAAPTYFASVDNKYIDGGIIANNPSLELLQEIQFWNSFNKYKNFPNSVNVGCFLSIGTGVIPPTPLEPTYLEVAQNWAVQPFTSINALLTIGEILVDQVAATEGVPVLRAGAFCIQQRAPFFRLSAPLFRNVSMDEKNDADIARMMWDCMEYMYKHQDYVERLCTLLRRVGHAEHRRRLFQPYGTRTHRDQHTQTSRSPSPAQMVTNAAARLLQMLMSSGGNNKNNNNDAAASAGDGADGSDQSNTEECQAQNNAKDDGDDVAEDKTEKEEEEHDDGK
ncbi:hypothetical protein niasHT_022765 [Heterodera trifolii]|uniref:phospholipase A2 n=1 Tax=Heterodera trifolii TaxID=157864 RepID=A0ABD2K668_9BILA